MNLLRPVVLALATAAVLGGCSRIAKPIDVHTQFVARDLVSPSCLQRCDVTGTIESAWYSTKPRSGPDGRIQYRLWPGTEIIAHSTGDEPPPEIPEQERPGYEFRCWKQCEGGMVATGNTGLVPDGGVAEGAASAEAVAPNAESSTGGR